MSRLDYDSYLCELFCGSEKDNLAELCADYMIDYGWSIRKIAYETGLSRTTIYRYINERLKYVDIDKYYECKSIMKKHKGRLRDDRTGQFKKYY